MSGRPTDKITRSSSHADGDAGRPSSSLRYLRAARLVLDLNPGQEHCWMHTWIRGSARWSIRTQETPTMRTREKTVYMWLLYSSTWLVACMLCYRMATSIKYLGGFWANLQLLTRSVRQIDIAIFSSILVLLSSMIKKCAGI